MPKCSSEEPTMYTKQIIERRDAAKKIAERCKESLVYWDVVDAYNSSIHTIRYLEDRFASHTKLVADFLNELYAIMVDPCAEGVITVAEMQKALVEAAKRDREVAQDEARASYKLAKQRVDIVERVMKLPYIKTTRNAEIGVERFVARDDLIKTIHDYAAEATA
jgi:hypothetical protein